MISDYFYFYIMPISSPHPMFEPLLESSHRDDSNKGSNKGFGEEITQVKWIIFFRYGQPWSSIGPRTFIVDHVH